MSREPVRSLPSTISCRQDRPDSRVAHLLGQRAGKARRLCPVLDVFHRRLRALARERDAPHADPHGVQPEDLTILDHMLFLSLMATAPYAPHADCRKEGAPHRAPHWYVPAMLGIVYQSTMEGRVNHAVIISVTVAHDLRGLPEPHGLQVCKR